MAARAVMVAQAVLSERPTSDPRLLSEAQISWCPLHMAVRLACWSAPPALCVLQRSCQRLANAAHALRQHLWRPAAPLSRQQQHQQLRHGQQPPQGASSEDGGDAHHHALLHASGQERTALVSLLLSCGCDPFLEDDEGRTALDLCTSRYPHVGSASQRVKHSLGTSQNKQACDQVLMMVQPLCWFAAPLRAQVRPFGSQDWSHVRVLVAPRRRAGDAPAAGGTGPQQPASPPLPYQCELWLFACEAGAHVLAVVPLQGARVLCCQQPPEVVGPDDHAALPARRFRALALHVPLPPSHHGPQPEQPPCGGAVPPGGPLAASSAAQGRHSHDAPRPELNPCYLQPLHLPQHAHFAASSSSSSSSCGHVLALRPSDGGDAYACAQFDALCVLLLGGLRAPPPGPEPSPAAAQRQPARGRWAREPVLDAACIQESFQRLQRQQQGLDVPGGVTDAYLPSQPAAAAETAAASVFARHPAAAAVAAAGLQEVPPATRSHSLPEAAAPASSPHRPLTPAPSGPPSSAAASAAARDGAVFAWPPLGISMHHPPPARARLATAASAPLHPPPAGAPLLPLTSGWNLPSTPVLLPGGPMAAGRTPLAHLFLRATVEEQQRRRAALQLPSRAAVVAHRRALQQQQQQQQQQHKVAATQAQEVQAVEVPPQVAALAGVRCFSTSWEGESTPTCVVCMDEVPVLGFRHARTVHACCCYSCAELLVTKHQAAWLAAQQAGRAGAHGIEPLLCPVCRQEVEEVVLV